MKKEKWEFTIVHIATTDIMRTKLTATSTQFHLQWVFFYISIFLIKSLAPLYTKTGLPPLLNCFIGAISQQFSAMVIFSDRDLVR